MIVQVSDDELLTMSDEDLVAAYLDLGFDRAEAVAMAALLRNPPDGPPLL